MQCSICDGNRIEVTYEGVIRDGKVGNLFKNKVQMYKCLDCGTIWHDHLQEDYGSFYESEEYRKGLEGTSEICDFYKMHDRESMDKFIYTGTEIYRDKIVADIGCAGGAFLDYINTVSKEVIAIEPSDLYRREMEKKKFVTFAYAKDAIKVYSGRVDVIVSFDVIEHVSDPVEFIVDASQLLSKNGRAYIGTPTDAPVMRELLGADYESFLFSTQHPWVLGKGSFSAIARKCSITQWNCKFYQRYGLGNMIYWLINRKPGQHKQYEFISKSLNEHWKAELERKEMSDYIVFEFEKCDNS